MGSNECLLSEITAFAQRMGPSATLDVYPGMVHVFQVLLRRRAVFHPVALSALHHKSEGASRAVGPAALTRCEKHPAAPSVLPQSFYY